MKCGWIGVFLVLVATLVGASSRIRAGDGIDLRLAKQYFSEAETLWKQDGGRLWGRSLNGPLLFVDRQTRHVVANQADTEGRLRKEGSLFVGELPTTVTVANTIIRWAGVQWIMVLWPLPKDQDDRGVLLMHESWHRVQNQRGKGSLIPGRDEASQQLCVGLTAARVLNVFDNLFQASRHVRALGPYLLVPPHGAARRWNLTILAPGRISLDVLPHAR